MSGYSVSTPDTEIVCAEGNLRLRVSPFGASLRGLWREAEDGTIWEIATGYTGAKNKVGGQGDVLIPFPGRVRDGRYTFEGTEHQMDRNDKDGPNAIHGFLRTRLWEISESSADRISFRTELSPDEQAGYPFALAATVSYVLEQGGLICRFTVTNTGDRAAPVAAGFHPYFTVGSPMIDSDLLHLPFTAFLEFANLLPTGNILPVIGTPFDFLEPRRIGATAFNTCFVRPARDSDGKVRIRLTAPDGDRSATVWMDETFDYVVLYSGDPLPDSHRRRALAIEPMTCASDAFNHPEWGLAALAPGKTLSGSWGVH